VPIGRLARDMRGADLRRGTRAVLHHEGMAVAEAPGEAFGQDPRRHVGGAARRDSDDDRHLPRRVGALRSGETRREQQGGGGEEDASVHAANAGPGAAGLSRGQRSASPAP